jgi:hypothetical protein
LTDVLPAALRAHTEPSLHLGGSVLQLRNSEDEVVDPHHGLER